jgi:hypothetical protein
VAVVNPAWERRSEWFAQTFKPIKKTPCKHPEEKLLNLEHYGQREIRCLVCGQVTARQVKP